MQVNYCPDCGRKVSPKAHFCENCGARLSCSAKSDSSVENSQLPSQLPHSVVVYELKKEGVALLLAFFGGLLLLGLGHIYIGKSRQGLILLCLGILLEAIVIASLGINIVVALIASLIFIVLWIGSTREVINLTRKYNSHLKAKGEPPW